MTARSDAVPVRLAAQGSASAARASAPVAVRASGRASVRGRLPVAFLTTAASTDLCLWWLLLPVWWAMGIEQVAAATLLLFTWARTMAARGRLELPSTLKLFVMFVGVYLLSGAFIVEPIRYVTFARGLTAYVGAFFVACLAFLACRQERRAHLLAGAFTAAMSASALTSVAGTYGLWRPEFTSLIGALLPGNWAETGYGAAMVSRSVGQEAWFLGLPFYRAKGTFLFSTMSATAMAATVPIAVYGILRASSRWGKAAYAISAALLVAALAASTGRMAALGLCAGAAVTLAALLVRTRWKRVAIGTSAVCACLIALQYIGPQQLVEVADQFVYARGDGSVTSRTEVYRATLAGIAERPILGWGTERDVDGLPYPAGSHSYYLGILYKHGVIGLAVMALVFWRVWRETTPTGAEPPRLRTLLVCARWSFLVVALNGLTDAPDLDGITLQAVWMVAGIALGTKGERSDSVAQAEPPARWRRLAASAR